MQFRPVCKDKPDGLRHLEEIGIGPSDQPIGRPRGSRGAQQVGSSDLALPKSLPTNASSVSLDSGTALPSHAVFSESNPIDGLQNPADPHARAGTADAKRKKSKRKSKLLSSKVRVFSTQSMDHIVCIYGWSDSSLHNTDHIFLADGLLG